MDLTVINNVWRPVYGKLVRALALLTPEWQKLKMLENFEQFSLRGINWPVELVHGGGIAYSEDGGSTARATSNEPVEASDTWKHMVGRFEVSFDVMKAENDAKFQKQQIEKQIRYQAQDKLRSFRRAVAINFYGHNTGILFLAEGTASNPSGTQTKVRVNDLYGEAGLTFARIRDYVTNNKDYLNIHAGTAATVRGGGQVVAIDEADDDITLATASDISASVADGDAIVLNNQVLSGADDDMDLWMNGLYDIMRATTLHGLAVSTNPDWVAGVDESSYGSALGGAALYEWFETIKQRSDYDVEWAYTTIGAIAAAGGAELDQRRYGADDDTMRLGFRKLNAMGVQVEAPSVYVPSGHVFMGGKALRKLSPDEAGVQDVVETGDRAGSFKQYGNQLGFYKDQVFRAQLTAVSRLGLGIVDGVTEA